MFVTPFGIVIFFKFSQLLNAEFPMFVTPFGIVILVKVSQLLNA